LAALPPHDSAALLWQGRSIHRLSDPGLRRSADVRRRDREETDPMIALLLLAVGFLGVVLTYVNIAVHAYREHGPLWGLGCLLVPNVNLLWGVLYWADEDSRKLFVRYLGYCGVFVLGMIVNRM
jgi:hypothetical protein